MKWLSHKFWLWVGRRIESHQFMESVNGSFDLAVDLATSVKLTDEELEAKKQAFQEAMGKHLEHEFTGISEDAFDGTIKKGYDKP